MEQQIPIAPETPQSTTTIPVAEPGKPGTPQLPDDQASNRALKAAWATGASTDEVKQQILQGSEDNLRQQVSSTWNEKSAANFKDRLYQASQDVHRPLTTNEMGKLVLDLNREQQFQEPKGIFEWATSQKYFNNLYTNARNTKGNWYDEFLRDSPQEEHLLSSVGRDYLANMQYLQTKRQNVEAEVKDQSMSGYLWDRITNFLLGGLPESYMERGNVPGVSSLSGFQGTNVEQQRIALHRMDPPTFRATVDKAVDYIVNKERHPSTALDWLDKMSGKGNPAMDNASTMLDIAGLVSGSVFVSRAARMFGHMVTNAGSKAIPEVAANAAVGNVPAAAEAAAAHAVTQNPVERIIDRLYDGYNAARTRLSGEPNSNYKELAGRIYDEAQASTTKLNQTLETLPKVDATSNLLSTPEGKAAIRQVVEDKYSSERVLGMSDPLYDTRTGTYWYELRLGTTKAGYWGRPEQAGAEARQLGLTIKSTAEMERQLQLEKHMARLEYDLQTAQAAAVMTPEQKIKLGLADKEESALGYRLQELERDWGKAADELYDLRQSPGIEIRNDGLGYYIAKWEGMNREAKATKDLFINAPHAQSPQGSISDFISALRTSGDTFSKDLFDNARVTTYAPHILEKYAKDEMKQVRKLRSWPLTQGRKEFNELHQVMKATQGMRNPRNGESGYIPGVGELQDIYLRMFDRTASDREVGAFYAWDRYEKLNSAIISLSKISREMNMGAEMHRIRTLDQEGKVQYSPWVVGVELPKKEAPVSKGKKGFPETFESILVSVKTLGKEAIRPSYRFTGRVRAWLEDAVEKGNMRSVKLLYPHENPLKGFGRVQEDHHITHIVGNIETKPLEFRHAPFNPWEYDAPFSLKQAILKNDPASGLTYYMGDRTIAHTWRQAEGKEMEKVMDATRKLIGEGKEQEAMQLSQDKLPMDWATHSGLYESGHLTSKQPIRLVPKGKRIADIDNDLRMAIAAEGGTYKDATLSPHFNGNPDTYEVYRIQNKGSKNNPEWSYEPAPKISPMSSIQRSFHALVNSAYLDEFKNTAINQWIRDAEKYIQVRDPSELYHSPYHFFYNGNYVRGIPTDVWSRLEGNRYKIQQILGTPSPQDTWFHQLGQKLADKAYEEGRPSFLIPAWLLPKVSDGATALRSIAYHAVMSWNPVQIMVQSMNYATIGGLAGYRLATLGGSAGFFHQLSRMNENWIPHFDKLLSNFGWKPGEFSEANKLLKSTGFQYIGREHLVNEGLYYAPVMSDGAHNFLNMSSMFFNAAERNQRFAAWYVAYKEFRDQNPSKAISNVDRNRIMGRADTLVGEMSSASKSLIQKGPLAFSAQFQSYSIRMTELMFGKRISPEAKFRTLATYAMLFGVPSTIGLAGSSYVSDMFRRGAEQHLGYVPGEQWYSTMINEGIPAHLIQLATGKLYNIGKRYASLGYDLDVDKGFLEIAGGAAYGMLSTAFDQGDPLIQSMQSLVRNDQNKYTPTLHDLNDAVKAWSAYGKGAQLWTALNTHEWLTRKGQLLETNVDSADAILRAFSGLQTQEISSMRNDRILVDGREKVWKTVESRVRREYQTYVAAERDKNKSEMDASIKRIQSIVISSGYPQEKISKLLGEAIATVRETAVERSQREKFTKDVGTKEAESLNQQYIRTLKLKGK